MENKIIQRIVKESGQPGLLDFLSKQISPSDLQSLLLEVYSKRAQKISVSSLKDHYQHNRFLQPSQLNPVIQLKLDQFCFEIAKENFEPIMLSPLAPLGVCSALAPVDQKKIVSTNRNFEVGADPTNVMALEAVLRRQQTMKKDPKNTESIRLCTSYRATRAQYIDIPNAFAHFQLFALCSAGRDTGSFNFEWEELEKQLTFYLNLMTSNPVFLFQNVEVKITALEERLQDLIEDHLFEKILKKFPQIDLGFDQGRKNGIGYYHALCFTINAENAAGEMLHLVDGGLTDWTQQLLGSKKERCLISAIGSERVGLKFYEV